MAGSREMVDATALEDKQKQLSGYLTGAFVSAMISLGMRLGLYTAMDGAGHGTLGMPETTIRAIARAVGFEQLRRLDLPHPLNAYYEVRL